MNPDTMLYDNLSESLMIWVLTLAVLFVIMLVGMCRSFRFSRNSRKQAIGKVRKLLLGDMLGRLNISLSRYYRHTSDLDRERHAWVCENCPEPEKCLDMLIGEDLDPDPATFCPNYDELKYLNPAHRASQVNSGKDKNTKISPEINPKISNAH